MSIAIIGTPIPGVRWLMPACLGTSSVTTFFAEPLIITNWLHFPASLETLSIQNCIFDPAESAVGFNSDGTLDWPEIFERVSSLVTFSISLTDTNSGLPYAIPSGIVDFSVVEAGMTGTIPPSLFSNLGSRDSITFSARDNELSGDIPDTLFQSTTDSMVSFYFDVSGNQLSGSLTSNLLPDTLRRSGSWADDFYFDVSDNQLSGTIPESFLAGIMSPGITIDIGTNAFSGTLPASLFEESAASTDFSFSAASAGLSGTLPESFFGTAFVGSGRYLVDLFNNSFTGAIPDRLITQGLSQTVTLQSFYLRLAMNQLNGSIPDALLYRLQALKRDDSTSSASVDADVAQETEAKSQNQDAGSGLQSSTRSAHLDGFNIYAYRPSLALTLDFSSNNLTGQIPEDIFMYNGVNTTQTSSLKVELHFDNNQFSGTIPELWQTLKISGLTLNRNTELTGSIPPRLLNETKIQFFQAIYTGLTGYLPSVGDQVSYLALDNTNIDFCGSTSTFDTTNGITCSILLVPNVCSCTARYSGCAKTCTPTTAPATPTATPAAPATAPTTASCPPSTRPSTDFQCVNGAWRASSITTPALSIPANAGNVYVVGNLASTTVSFTGIGSTIFVGGCVTGLTNVEVSLDNAQVKALSQNSKAVFQPLVDASASTATNCGSSSALASTVVSSRTTKKSCKKVSNQKDLSNNGKTMGAFFSVSTTGCNTWWIVLAAVLGGVVLAAVIVIVLLATFCEPIRRKIRPYEQSEGRHSKL